MVISGIPDGYRRIKSTESVNYVGKYKVFCLRETKQTSIILNNSNQKILLTE